VTRLRMDFTEGNVDTLLGASDVTMHSIALAAMPVVAGVDTLAIILDPDGTNGLPEIVWVTAHTAAATTATILRHQESTAARIHPAGEFWTHGPTAMDFDMATGILFGTPGASAVGDVIAAGTSGLGTQADHVHGREGFGTPGSSTVGDVAANGSALTVAHSDHVHGREAWGLAGDVGTETFGAAAAAGASGKVSDAGHIHPMPAGVVRATQTLADPGQTGDVNLVFTGLNRSASGGSEGVFRGEAQSASLQLQNTTGTDLALTHNYEAIRISPGSVTTIGAVIVRLKKAAGTTATGTITASLYTDAAGQPGTILPLNNGPMAFYANDLSTSAYTPCEFLLRASGLTASINYWVVLTIAGVSVGNFILDTTATGGAYATSPDASTWTTTASSAYVEVRGQNIAGVQGTSETYVGVRGDSAAYFGVYGNSITGVGVHGGSTSGIAVEGVSVDGYGVYGNSQLSDAVYGASTNGFGVHGVANGGGVVGDCTTGFAGVKGNNTGAGPGVWGANGGNGDGVTGTSSAGTGFGVHSEGYFGLTHGWGFTATAGANAGGSPPAPVTTGVCAVRGTITFGTGTAPAAGAMVVFGFPGGRPCPTTPIVLLTPINAATAALQLYVTGAGTTGFTVSAGVAPAASQANTVYGFTFLVVG
jgi:hypothetical protein